MVAKLKTGNIIISLGLLISVAAVSFFRILILNNFHNDEGYYLSTIYRISLGDQDFAVSFLDLFAFLLSPISNLFLTVTNFGEGYALFFHLVYWAFTWGVCFFCFFCLKKLLSPFQALIVSLAYPLYLHYYPLLFYTNLGAGIFAVCLFFIFFEEPTGRGFFFPAIIGVLAALASFSHAGGYLIPSIVIWIILFWTRKFHMRDICFSVLAFVCTILALFYWGNISVQSLLESARIGSEYSKHDGIPMNFSKFVSLGEWLFYSSPIKGLGFLINAPLIIMFFRKRHRVKPYILYFWLPLTYLFVFRGIGNPSNKIYIPSLAGGAKGLIQYIALCGPMFYFLLQEKSAAKPLLIYVWIPSITSALCLAFTSNTGPGNFGIGMLPGFIASSIFLSLLIQGDRTKARFYSLIPSLIFLFLLGNYLVAYTDFKTFERAKLGPLKGLLVKKGVDRYSEDMVKALNRIESLKKGRILFECNSINGYAYLFSKQKPGVTNTWSCQVSPELCKRLRTAYPFKEISTLIYLDSCQIQTEREAEFELVSNVGAVKVYERK